MDITQTIKDFNSKALSRDGKEITFKTVLQLSLAGDLRHPASPKLSADDSMKCFDLGVRISQAEGDIELDTEEKAFLIKIVLECTWTPLVFGQAKLLLNGKPTGL